MEISTVISLGTLIISFTLSSSTIGCSKTVAAQEEIESLLMYAREFTDEIDHDFEFESSEVRKCGSKQLDFTGYFKKDLRTADSLVSEYIYCRQFRDFRGRALIYVSHHCRWEFEQSLIYQDVDEPIALNDGITLAEAKNLMAFVSGLIGRTIDGQTFTESHFSSISQIRRKANSPFRDFVVYYSSGDNDKELTVISSRTGNGTFELVNNRIACDIRLTSRCTGRRA